MRSVGFEPTTVGSEDRCSIQLSHERKAVELYLKAGIINTMYKSNSKPRPFNRERNSDQQNNYPRGDRPQRPAYGGSYSGASRTNTSWDKVAPWYDEHLSTDNHHKQVVLPGTSKLIAKYFPQKLHSIAVLDIGCGQGIMAEQLLKERKIDYVGIDNSAELLKLAAKHAHDNVKFIKANAESFIDTVPELTADKFDLACSILAVQNIEDIGKAFSQAGKALKKGGLFLFVVTHPAFRVPKHSDWGEDRYAQMMYRKVDLYKTATKIPILEKPFKSQLNNTPTETTWTFHRPLEEYVKSLATAGMAIVDMEEWNSHKTTEPSNPKARMENRARQEIPMFMCVVARKL